MPKVLVVSGADLTSELGGTVLWRREVERSFAGDSQSAFDTARSVGPNLIVLDGGLPDALPAIRRLRGDPATRSTAIAVVSRAHFLDDAEALLAAGATVIVPPDASPMVWDGRLEELLTVPQRREARIPVRMELWARPVAGDAFVEGTALNVSLHGLLIESTSPLEVGAKLDLRFRLPGRDDELQAVGEVVRQDQPPRSGIRFLVLRGEAREAIRAFVAGVAVSLSDDGRDLAARRSEGHEWEAMLRATEALKAATLEAAPYSIVIMSHEGRIVQINRAVEKALGYRRDQLVGRLVTETIARPLGSDPQRRALIRDLATGGGSLLERPIEMTLDHADGSAIPVELTVIGAPMMGRVFYAAFVRDLRAAKRAERLRAATHRIAEVAATAADVTALFAAIHEVLAELMHARSFFVALRDEPSGALSLPYLVGPPDATPAEPGKAKILAEHVLRPEPSSPEDMGGWLGVPLQADGEPFGVIAVQSGDPAIALTDEDREVLGVLSPAIGVALQRKQAEERIEYLAYYDGVTGLPNRKLLLDRLQLAAAQSIRDRNRMAVLVVNLDRLKAINESLGHTVGDQVVKAVATRLQRHVRKGDTLARSGGDEFTVLLRGIREPADAGKVAQTLQDVVGEPLTLGGRELYVTASVGISVFPEDGLDDETLLKNAGTALHRAKEQGQETFRLYDPSMNAQALQWLRLEHDLRRALSRNELVVYYQPLVDLASGEIHGSEALLRWQHPERGLVLPTEFIHIAESTGVIRPIGAWALKEACRQARAWQERHPRLSVAVNLSARQLQHRDLVGEVTKVLEETGLAPEFLELEITESSAMRDAGLTIGSLAALKSLGVRISIDDFGIGYSSLSQLQRLPIDILKIDQAFVRDLATDPHDAAIVAAVIRLGHTSALRVVAEGVETREQLAFLVEHDCDRIQGYLYARPLPATECAAVFAAHDAAAWRSTASRKAAGKPTKKSGT